MTVIFSKRDDTMFLQKIWEGLEDVNVVEIESQDDYFKVEKALVEEREVLLLCGHGTPSGLIAPTLGHFMVGDQHIEFLKGKTLIGIWCYAALFADYHHLSGFFSNMFISDIHEAASYGYCASSSEIEKENYLFATRVNDLLKRKIPVEEWDYVMSQYRLDYPTDSFAYFNYCGLVNLNYNEI